MRSARLSIVSRLWDKARISKHRNDPRSETSLMTLLTVVYQLGFGSRAVEKPIGNTVYEGFTTRPATVNLHECWVQRCGLVGDDWPEGDERAGISQILTGNS